MSVASEADSRKRRRTDETSACSCAASNDLACQAAKKDVFHVTFQTYGTIKLAKTPLQNFPSSLISQTLLGDDTANAENKLYVPIGCGLDSVPQLVREIYNGGSPSKIPQLGLDFDLFFKWLRYLGLATSGRSLSTETEAAKRVSCCVEVFINTAKLDSMREHLSTNGYVSRLSSNKVICVNLHPDVARYRHNLLPFEFARRGIHMTLQQGDKESEMDDKSLRAWNLSKLRFGENDYGCRPDEGFRLPLPHSDACVPPGTVVNVVKYDFDVDADAGGIGFHHKCRYYRLSIKGELLGSDGGYAKVVLGGAGCSCNTEETREDIILCSSRDDLVQKFREGGMMYSREEYGVSYIAQCDAERDDGSRLQPDLPLIAGMENGFCNGDEQHDLAGKNVYMLIVASKSQPILEFGSYSHSNLKKYKGDIWKITVDESPEWALCTEGAAP